MSEIKIGDKIVSENKEYIVLDLTKYEGVIYYFVNQIISNVPSDNFLVIFINNENVELVYDKNLLDKLLLIFTNNLK